MNFRNGYLGGMIVVLAVVLTIAGSWVLSLDVEDVEKTEYNYVTELTGLFDTEQAPTYIEYNPSTNYTGYYTNTYTKYFDGVDYTQSSQRNQYRLNLAPTSSTDEAVDLSTVTGSADEDWLYVYWTDNNTIYKTTDVDHLSFSDLLTALSVSSYDAVTFVSDFDSYTAGGFVSFVYGDMLRTPGMGGSYDHLVYEKNPSLTGTLKYNDTGVPEALRPTYAADSIHDPILAASYDADIGYITLYYDVGMTEAVGIYATSDVYIVWDTSTGSSFNLGYEMTMTGADYPDAEYLDPRYGVSVE